MAKLTRYCVQETPLKIFFISYVSLTSVFGKNTVEICFAFSKKQTNNKHDSIKSCKCNYSERFRTNRELV